MKTFTEFSAKYVNVGLIAYIKDLDRECEIVSCDALRPMRNRLLKDAEQAYSIISRSESEV